jgi:hypothetical protein
MRFAFMPCPCGAFDIGRELIEEGARPAVSAELFMVRTGM